MTEKINYDRTKLALDGRYYDIDLPDGSIGRGRSVTTVLDQARIKGFIDEWEWEMMRELGMTGFNEYMKKKAWEGTQLHELVELYLQRVQDSKFEYLQWEEQYNKHVWKKFLHWIDWYNNRKPTIVWMEKKLQSVELMVGGRADCLAVVEEGAWLFDWKSSKDVYDKHLIQLATYMKLFEEMSGIKLAGGSIIATGMRTQKGWKETSLITGKKHKGSGICEVEHYFNGFKHINTLLDWYEGHISPNDIEYPEFIMPIRYERDIPKEILTAI